MTASATPGPDAIERVVAVLARAPAGLLTDIDGTISQIAPTPDAARVAPEIAATLDRLAGRLAVVAAVTGRGVADAARLVGAERVLYIGNHGMERHGPEGGAFVPAAAPYLPLVRSVLRQAEAAATAAGWRGLRFEDKGVTASIHYRQAPEPPAAREALLALVAPLAAAAGLRLTEGRFVLELRPPVRIDKGTALGAVVDAYALRGAVFLGDDVTDIDAMRELRRRRDAGAITGVTIGVATAESPPALRAASDLLVGTVEAVAALLAAVAARLG